MCPVKKGVDAEVECSIDFESCEFNKQKLQQSPERLPSPFTDFLTAEDVTYEFKPNGLLVSDGAKKLLENQGWKLTEAEPTSSEFDVEGSEFKLG